MANIKIDKDEDSISRSQLEERLRGEGWGKSMSDAQLEKVKYLERKLKRETGLDKGKLHDDFIKAVSDGL